MSAGNSTQVADLWTRHLAGESMTTEERGLLADAFATDEVFRRRVLHDQRLDGAIRAEVGLRRDQPRMLEAVYEAVRNAVRGDRLVARLRPHLEAAAEDARVLRRQRAESRRAWTRRGIIAGLALTAGLAAAMVVGLRPGTQRAGAPVGRQEPARGVAAGGPPAQVALAPTEPGMGATGSAPAQAEADGGIGPGSRGLAVLVTGADDPHDLEDQNSADEVLRARLEQLGFDVHFQLPDAPNLDDVRRARVVVLSPSVATGVLSDELIALPVPIVVLESSAYSRVGLTGPNWKRDLGVSPILMTDIVITDPSHPLAAGLTGPTNVLVRRHRLRWGIPGPGAVSIATYQGAAANRSLYFGYERGAAMPGGIAPARRVAMCLGNAHIVQRLTPAGWRLFDAAVSWSADDVR